MKNFTISLIISIVIAATVVYLTESGVIPWEKITGRYYSIPDMTGLSRDNAEVLVRAGDLKLDIAEKVYSQEYEKGIVISQTPLKTKKSQLDLVKIVVSKGTPVIYMPDLIGVDGVDAEAELKARSLNTIKTILKYSSKTENKVIQTRPEAGEGINYDTPIEITVSKGPKMTTVPDIKVKSLSNAKSILNKNNLQLGHIKKETNIEQRFGVILRQFPPPGRKVEEGTSVTIVLNEEER
ncbi:MAG: PASTA domain-containing protein [Elusimicrobia bacterium]|jgi:beta-lactam-binding protein with PASTA domain|nr:PASTA domain-containing protein [Elusimicrobiota bacterium]